MVRDGSVPIRKLVTKELAEECWWQQDVIENQNGVPRPSGTLSNSIKYLSKQIVSSQVSTLTSRAPLLRAATSAREYLLLHSVSWGQEASHGTQSHVPGRVAARPLALRSRTERGPGAGGFSHVQQSYLNRGAILTVHVSGSFKTRM